MSFKQNMKEQPVATLVMWFLVGVSWLLGWRLRK